MTKNIYYHIIILGGPGAGKDTMAKLIRANSSREFEKISPGEILRKTPGKKCNIISDIIKPYFQTHLFAADYIFTGFPANRGQVEYYFKQIGINSKTDQPPVCPVVINLLAENDTLVRRMHLRNRPADSGREIQRIELFRYNISDVIHSFTARGIVPDNIIVNSDNYAPKNAFVRRILKQHKICCDYKTACAYLNAVGISL